MGFAFAPERFQQMVCGMGHRAHWLQSTLCPCQNTHTGGADLTCSLCGGVRFLWSDPVEVVIGVQTQQQRRRWAPMTEWLEGDAIVTIPPESPAMDAKEYDRFVILDARYPYVAILKRDTKDIVKHALIHRVNAVWAIINDARVDFIEDVDYRINGNQVVWLTGTLPSAQQYTIEYDAAPEYYVYQELSRSRIYFRRAMPRMVHVRLMDLFSQSLR